MGRLCTIVGMGPGVSLGVARKFSSEGFEIAMISRNRQKLEAFQIPNARAFEADSGNEDTLRVALQQVHEAMGPTEVLVYNASALHPGTPSQLSTEDMLADFRVNVVGAAIAAQQVLPGMKAAKRGTILLTGGGLALDPIPQYASLAVGKAGIRSLAISLAKECDAYDVHVATVTICGFVQEGTRFDPERIAAEYWRLYSQPKGEWDREMIYR